MNWDQIAGNCKGITGRAKEQWSKLTDDDLEVVAGRREPLAGKIQARYGVAKDEAERQLAAWQRAGHRSVVPGRPGCHEGQTVVVRLSHSRPSNLNG